MVRVTHHGKQRARERVGLKGSALSRILPRVMEEGICHSETTGRLKKYMDWLFLSYGTGSKTRIYGNQVYIITSSDVLVTVVPLAHEYKDAVRKLFRRKANHGTGSSKTVISGGVGDGEDVSSVDGSTE